MTKIQHWLYRKYIVMDTIWIIVALKSMLFVYFDVVQIIFKMFEIAQIITTLRVVANSLIFTTNPRMNILNVKLRITKTNVFY